MPRKSKDITPQAEKTLRRLYPDHSNSECARALGVCERTIRRLAEELQLSKSSAFYSRFRVPKIQQRRIDHSAREAALFAEAVHRENAKPLTASAVIAAVSASNWRKELICKH